MQTLIEVKNLKKKYGDKTVVNDISFHIEEGEVFGLLGHNGAGKSTTIETILGLKKPEGGSALLFGKKAAKHRSKIFNEVGVQLQSSNYQNNIRVEEVCQERQCLYQNPIDYMELLRVFGLEDKVKQPVEKLSGGEKQKLAVALALLPRPRIVFLDELTTGLDVVARREVWRILKQLKNQGMTIVLTTHYMEEAEELCDRVFLIKSGKKVVEGTVEQVIADSPYDNLEEAYLWYMGEEEEAEIPMFTSEQTQGGIC